MAERTFIPFHRPSIGEEEIAEVIATLRSGWLTTGERAVRLEQAFQNYIGCRHALAVNSCTSGLHLALAAAGIGRGDEVITTPITFCATVNAILHVGATPLLADVLPDGNIDPASIEQRITANTRAIIPVHLGGLPCRMDEIWELARKNNLLVIEDAAHAVGAWYGDKPLGSAESSAAVAFSFYATKNMTTGEGGLVATNRRDLAERMRVLCLHGIDKGAWNRYTEQGSWYYQVLEPGFKYNLSDVQAAIGLRQLERLEHFQEARTEYAALYAKLLAGCEEVETAPECTYGRHAWHLYIIRLRLEKLVIDRAEFIDELRRRGIGASVHFIPIPLHPFFDKWARLPQNHCPQAMALYPRLISLPLYPAMTVDEVEYVARSVKEIAHVASRSHERSAGAVEKQ